MKKIIIGFSGLISGQQYLAANDIQKIENSYIQELNKENGKISKINSKNLIKSRIFYEELSNYNIILNLENYRLIDNYVILDGNNYKLVYVIENDFFIKELSFPISFNNGIIEKIYPIYYDVVKNTNISYQINNKNKKIKSEIFNNIFNLDRGLFLNKNSSNDKYEIVIFDIGSKLSYEKILNYFDKNNNIKKDYKDTNILIYPVSLDYSNEITMLELSTMLKLSKNKEKALKLFINYLKDLKEIRKNIEQKYFKKYRNGYPNEFILDLYNEINKSNERILNNLLSDLLSLIHNDKTIDIKNEIEKEKKRIDKLIRIDLLENEFNIYKYFEGSKYYYPVTD